LDLYGIVFIGNELDFSNLYEQYIKWNWTQHNWPMYERLWDDVRLHEILQYRIQSHNNLKDFCEFVLQYES
jgi:hypothetical protein